MILKGDKRRARRHPLVLWSRIKLYWPLLIWLAAIVFVVLVFDQSRSLLNLSGVVRTVTDRIAPLETARVAELLVGLGDLVEAGQVLAVMDSAALESELLIERMDMQQRIDSDVWRLQAEIREMTLETAKARAELGVLAAELERQRALLREGLADAAGNAELEARRDALKSACETYPRLIAAAESQLDQALAKRGEIDAQWSDEQAGGEGLIARRVREHSLRARRDGRVSEILCQPGDVLAAGEPALLMVADTPPEVIALIPELLAREVEIGMRATIRRAVMPDGRQYRATLSAISPEIKTWPSATNNPIRSAQRGEWALFCIDEAAELIPGERVSIDIRGGETTPLLERIIGFFKAE
jgi:multidrug resistance efflux pump